MVACFGRDDAEKSCFARHKLTQAGFRVLTIQKERAVHPALLAEFVRPRFLRRFVWLGLKGLFKLKLLQSAELMADLYALRLNKMMNGIKILMDYGLI